MPGSEVPAERRRGRPPVSRGPFAAGVILAVVMAAGLVFTVLDRAVTRPGAAARATGLARILDGSWAASWQSDFEESLPFRNSAAALWTLFRYRLFGEARQEVLVGSDGWLFSTEEFAPPAPLAVPLPQALERIDAARAIAVAKGVSLVVALVPTKASVERAHLGRYMVPPDIDARYEVARAAIAALGVAAPDLRTPLTAAAATEDMYLRTDTHWTPAGARRAADVLAATIVPLLVKEESARIAFDTETGAPEPLRGDLLKFVPLGPWQNRGPVPDTVAIPHATPAASPPDATEDSGLFGELDIPVSLVGTSYSANPASGFETALKDALDADVLNVAVEGKGPFEPMDAYLDSSAIDNPRPDAIVWEIPERYLIPPASKAP